MSAASTDYPEFTSVRLAIYDSTTQRDAAVVNRQTPLPSNKYLGYHRTNKQYEFYDEASSRFKAFSGNQVVTVAASTANAITKALANYVCDGTNDEEQVNAAAAKVAADNPIYGGLVELSEGLFNVGSSDSTKITGTTSTVEDSNTSYCKICVSTNYTHIDVGDVVVLYGGDSTTMQSKNCDGVYSVRSKSTDLGVNFIELDVPINGPYTNVTYTKPAYGIQLPKQVSLHGKGKLKTQLKLQVNANCCALHLQSTALQAGGHTIRDLSIYGNSTNQTSTDWREDILMATGLSYDVHVLEIELRYGRGYGLVVGEGWGYRHYGGWIEDCFVNAFIHGPAIINTCKIQQAGTAGTGSTASTDASRNVALYESSARLLGCELRTDDNNVAAVSLLAARKTNITGCEIEAKSSSDACIETVKFDGNSASRLLAESNTYVCADAACSVLKLNDWLLGGSVSGLVTTDIDEAVVGFRSFAHALQLDLSGGAFGMHSNYQSHNSACLNNTGGVLTDYYAYVWDNSSTSLDAVKVAAATADLSGFAGVHNSYPIGDAAQGALIDYGFSQVSVNSTAAILAQDLLSMSTANWGQMKKAVAGEISYARALEAASTGSTNLKAFIIHPRTKT